MLLIARIAPCFRRDARRAPLWSFLRHVLRRFFFKLHGATRGIRHPLRERRYRLHPETAPAQVGYPRPFTVTDNVPDGHYTDARGRRLTRDEVTSLPRGTRIYRFGDRA